MRIANTDRHSQFYADRNGHRDGNRYAYSYALRYRRYRKRRI